MILVKKNPRGKVIRELSSEEETAVKTVCGLKKPATMALHNLANDILREMREYDAWLQCDYIPGDSPAMNFAGLKKVFICPVLIMSMHLNILDTRLSELEKMAGQPLPFLMHNRPVCSSSRHGMTGPFQRPGINSVR